MLLERKRRLHHRARHAGHCRLDAEIHLLPMPLLQLRLVVKRIHLTNAAVHEELDDAADFGFVMQATIELRPRFVGPGEEVATEEMSESKRTEAAAGVA